jgi:hypothetical protein
MALVGGATRQPLLLRLLRHHQHTADESLSVELNGDRLDPSTGLAATLAARIVSGGRLIVVADAQRPLESQVVKTRSLGWIQVEGRRESEGGWCRRPRTQLELESLNSESALTEDVKVKFCVPKVACVPRGGRPSQYIRGFLTPATTV